MKPAFRLLPLAFFLSTAAPLAAQQGPAAPPPEEQEELDTGSIVVTGARVRQGGAQDARHFRSSAEISMPRVESLTFEGLIGEYDLALPAGEGCAQLFCLAAEAMPAVQPLRPDDRLFVGLGFASNIDPERWTRDPLHLVAVVDKSGSMEGEPLALVRKSLAQIVGQMREGDRISIVLYGDESHLYLPPTDVAADRDAVLKAIRGIESAGSTNMEEGLRVGYDTAFAEKGRFAGKTRVMLFTDEQPNVGATDAESFMGMAEAASRGGIGLTTIGVGVQFDGALATRVSSVRGGNLFFISDEEEVKSVFAKQLDTMVSELAHDVRITMTPRAGYRLTGVFGVPDGLMTEGADGAVTVTVPTAFLSTEGGGIFASLGKSSERANLPAAPLDDGPLMEVTLSYVAAADGKAGSDRLEVANPVGVPSQPLRLAHLLLDEYLTLGAASTAFHRDDDPKRAHALLSAFDKRLAGSRIGGLEGERKLVARMLGYAAFYAGYGGEQPAALRPLAVRGTWEVFRADGIDKVRRGDRMSFLEDDEYVSESRGGEEETGTYRINERQIFFPEEGLVFNYRADEDSLLLAHEGGAATIRLRRVSDPET